jgi:hypothetical protein
MEVQMNNHKLNPLKELDTKLDQNRWERALRRLDFCRDKLTHCTNSMQYSSDPDFWARQIEYYRTEIECIKSEFPNVKL